MKNYLWITIFFFQILWISCTDKPSQTLSKQVFYMNLDAGLSTLDPAYARDQASDWMTAQIFNGLVELDTALSPRPAIAKRWKISDDGMTYTFYLRDDVLFHEHAEFGKNRTRNVVASDFVYTFTRICNPQTASTGQWVFKGKISGLQAYQDGLKNEISGFRAANDTTFEVRLTRPFPPFLGLLTMPYCRVVPHEVVSALGEDFRMNPIGTGPFRFYDWQENYYLILHKNTSYFERIHGETLPYLDAIKVSFIPSRLSAFIEFLQGKLDMLNGLDDSYKDELFNTDGTVREKYIDSFRIVRAPQLNTEYLGILVDSTRGSDHPLLDVRVRKALNYAIDRQKLVTYLLNEMGYPTETGFIPRGMPAFAPEKVQGFTYDPVQSRKLLEDAGYPGGTGLPEITLHSTPKYENIAEFIQKSFENVGVRLSIENLQGGALRTEIYNSQIQFWRASWIADYPDGENYLALFYSKNHSPSGPNTTHFSIPAYDNLYETALQIPHDSLRFILYQQMENMMLQHAPIIPLYYDRSLRLVQHGISGFYSNPMNQLILKYIRKADQDSLNTRVNITYSD